MFVLTGSFIFTECQISHTTIRTSSPTEEDVVRKTQEFCLANSNRRTSFVPYTRAPRLDSRIRPMVSQAIHVSSNSSRIVYEAMLSFRRTFLILKQRLPSSRCYHVSFPLSLHFHPIPFRRFIPNLPRTYSIPIPPSPFSSPNLSFFPSLDFLSRSSLHDPPERSTNPLM